MAKEALSSRFKDLLRRYGAPAIMFGLLALNFSPHYHQQSKNPSSQASSLLSGKKRAARRGSGDAIEKKDRKNVQQARLRSLYWAFKSSTLRNMVLVAAAVTLLARRFVGIKANRAFPAFLATTWALIYKWRVVESPKVFFRESFWNRTIVEKSKLAQTEFWPVFFLFNRHAQTVTCFALSALEWLWARTIEFERETIPCYDEPNEQYLDWAFYRSQVVSSLPGHEKPFDQEAGSGEADGISETPIIICIHGLGDHRDVPYLKRFARMAMRNGWRVVAWSYWRFDFAESRDLKIAIDHINRKYPRAPLVAIGWSAGVYALTQYLQKAGADTPLVAAVCQSGCLDFVQAVEDVTNNENTAYPLFLLGQAHVCIRRHVNNDKRIVDKTPFNRLMLEELDPMKLFNRFFSLLPECLPDTSGGYGRDGSINPDTSLPILERLKDAPHYAHRVIDNMDKIKITTLLCHAEDDPIVSSEHACWEKCTRNRHIIAVHTHRGGHCAWHEGVLPFGDTWGDRLSCNFISSVLESQATYNFIVELVRTAMSSAQFYARPTFGQSPSIPAYPGTPNTSGNSGSAGGEPFTPRSMARICSASDLQTMAAPPLTQMTQNYLQHNSSSPQSLQF